MRKKLLLFDLDCTLVNTGGAGVRAYNRGFERVFGIANGLATVPIDGKTDRSLGRELIRLHLNRDPKDGEIEAICAGYIEHLPEEVATSRGFQILPGIEALLKTLAGREDVMLALGTGNLQAGAKIKLARPNLWRYFPVGGFADDSEFRPDLLRAGVTRAEAIHGRAFPPRDVVVIGDNWRDVDAGKAIGATTVAVASGPMTAAELAAHDPDHVFLDFSDTERALRVLTV